MKAGKTLLFLIALTWQFAGLQVAAGQGQDSCELWIKSLDNLYNEKKYTDFMVLTNRVAENCDVENHFDTLYAKYWNAIAASNVLVGNLNLAFKHFERATAMLDSLRQTESLDYMAALFGMASILYYQGDYIRSEQYAERAFPLALKLTAPKQFVRGQGLYMKGQFLFHHEKYADCISVLEEALGCREGASELELNYFRLEIFSSLAVSYWQLGQFQKADETFAEMLRMVARFKHPQSYVFQFNAGVYYRERGDLKKAFTLLSQSVEWGKKNKKQNELFYGMALSNLAVVYRDLGQYAKAVELTEEAQQYLDKAAPTNRIYKVTILNNLGFLFLETNQFSKAIPLQEAVLKEYETVENLPPSYAIWLTNLAASYQQMGQKVKARSLITQAMDLSLRQPETSSYYQTGIVSAVAAHFYLEIGQPDSAILFLRTSLKIWEEVQGEQGIQYLQSLAALGIAYFDKGDLALAEQTFEKALDRFSDASLENNNTRSSILQNLGQVHATKKDYQKARHFFREALSGIERFAGKYNLQYSRTLNFLGEMEAALGNDSIAFSHFRIADSILHSQLVLNFEIFNERDKTSFLQVIQGGFERYAHFAMNHPELPGAKTLVFEDDLALRGLLLYSTNNVRDAIFSSGNATLQAQYKQWLDLKQLYIFQVSAQPGFILSKTELDSVAQQVEILETDLVRNSKAFQQARQRTTWKELKTRLAQNSAIVTFTSFREKTDTVYAALVARWHDPEPALVRLCKKSELEDALFATGFQQEKIDKTYDYGKYGDDFQLYHLVWQPLEKHLEGADTVYYAPSGLLHKVSFPAISLPDSSLLLDAYHRLEYVDNATQVGARHPLDGRSIRKASIFGSIDYSASREALAQFTQPECSLAEFLEVYADSAVAENKQATMASTEGVLVSTKGEFGQMDDQVEVDSVENICKQFGKQTETLRGATASEEQVKNGRDADLLHLSTHGFFSDPANQSNLIQTAPLLTDDPLFHGGLAMAGSNHAAQGNPPYRCFADGILYANEIALLDLTKVKMVVLSACETGLGEARGSEGVYGLQRGFKRAGAQRLLMTLWQIHTTEGTPDFMKTFYRHWFSGMEVRDAFYLTQREMRKKYKHPYLWAGFVLI